MTLSGEQMPKAARAWLSCYSLSNIKTSDGLPVAKGSSQDTGFTFCIQWWWRYEETIISGEDTFILKMEKLKSKESKRQTWDKNPDTPSPSTHTLRQDVFMKPRLVLNSSASPVLGLLPCANIPGWNPVLSMSISSCLFLAFCGSLLPWSEPHIYFSFLLNLPVSRLYLLQSVFRATLRVNCVMDMSDKDTTLTKIL